MLFAHETLRPEGPTNTFSGPTKIAPSSCKSDIHFHTLFTPPPTLTPPIVSLQELPALFQRFPSSDFHFHTLFTNSHPPYSLASTTPCAGYSSAFNHLSDRPEGIFPVYIDQERSKIYQKYLCRWHPVPPYPVLDQDTGHVARGVASRTVPNGDAPQHTRTTVAVGDQVVQNPGFHLNDPTTQNRSQKHFGQWQVRWKRTRVRAGHLISQAPRNTVISLRRNFPLGDKMSQ